MTIKITPEQANRLGVEQGGFISLDTLVREYGLSFKAEGRILRDFFSRFLAPQVEEALRETEHIQRALSRLRRTCHEGGRMHDRTFYTGLIPVVDKFQRDLWTLDGWVASLYETDLSLVGFVNHQMALRKVQQFGSSMNALMAHRASELSPFTKDPALFADYFRV